MPHGAIGACADQDPHKNPTTGEYRASRPARPTVRRATRSRVLASGAGRPATRGDGDPVIELEYGITVYPAREGQDRWRAVWYENGQRRQCEAISEERLAAMLEKVTGRLAADAPNMERTGADLIAHYLDPDRLPAGRRWSRKHAHTQRRLCERFAAPVIGGVACQDIKTLHMQQVVNAAPTAKEGARVHGMISAGAVRPQRTPGGRRRYTRRQLAFAARIRELLDQGHTLAAGRRILDLENGLAAERALTARLRERLAGRDG